MTLGGSFVLITISFRLDTVCLSRDRCSSGGIAKQADETRSGSLGRPHATEGIYYLIRQLAELSLGMCMGGQQNEDQRLERRRARLF
jgi:hypothetical protein